MGILPMSRRAILALPQIGFLHGQDARGTHGRDAHATCHTGSEKCPFFWVLILLLAAGAGLGAQPAARKPLPETAVLDRADGRIVHMDANDTWLFELTAEVKTPEYRLPAGTRFVLLPSGTLGRLIADVNDRFTPRYRLSARITLYRGKNYLFPTYCLPLSRFKDDKNPEDTGQKTEDGSSKQKSTISNQKPGEPELTIPPEVLEQLKKRRPPRGPRRRAEAAQTPTPEVLERVLADCVGRIQDGSVGSQPTRPPNRYAQNAWVKNPPYAFVPYALGWNIGDVRYELLPSTALEQALQMQKQSLDPMRLNVAGLVTEFKGKKYLLLQRAIIVYSYGNFGR